MSSTVFTRDVWKTQPTSSCRRQQLPRRGKQARNHRHIVCFQSASELDVSGATINPYYRSVPRDTNTSRSKVALLFLGESNVCRSVLAETLMRDALAHVGLGDIVECQSKGTRDYQVGESPDRLALKVAEQLKLQLPESFTARHFCPEKDVVDFDLLLVMDKYTAADVLREVTGYDLVDKESSFSSKVRLLGQFHPGLAKLTEPEAQDIGDPLYGNMGGPEEQEAVLQSAHMIEEACLGLAQYLKELHDGAAAPGEASFLDTVKQKVRTLEKIDWLVPPMLQGRSTPPIPFI